MKTKNALYIAQLIYDDTFKDGSLFDQLMKSESELKKLMKDGKAEQAADIAKRGQEEIIARWANLISENSYA